MPVRQCRQSQEHGPKAKKKNIQNSLGLQGTMLQWTDRRTRPVQSHTALLQPHTAVQYGGGGSQPRVGHFGCTDRGHTFRLRRLAFARIRGLSATQRFLLDGRL